MVMWGLVIDPDANWRLARREFEPPTPTPEQAVIAVATSSINRGELSLLKVRSTGWRPGQDVAGVVVEPAADGSGPAAGARVVGLAEQGGWSQQVAVPTSRLVELPAEVSVDQAAALPLAGLTALRTLRLGGELLGRRVLITGASGGVGNLQVQLAAAGGATVTAVSTRADAATVLGELGAAQVVASVDKADGPFDLIAESVGGDSLAGAIRAIAPGGTIVMLGASSAESTPLSIYDFIGGHENARIQTYFSYSTPGDIAADLRYLVDLVATGRLVPTLGRIDDWAHIEQALAAVADRTTTGKVVLRITR
jgi:NADPH:quinone reductase